MNLEDRIEKLETIINVEGNPPPLILISSMDCSREPTEPTTLFLGIIPGMVGGQSGVVLTRGEDEGSDDFLERCEARHAEFYS